MEVDPQRLPILSLLGSLAASDAIRALTDLEPCLKWPNDLLLENRKVAGILVETLTRPKQPPLALLGLGLNLLQELSDFPQELRKSAISLRQASGLRIPRIQALATFLTYLDQRLHQAQGDILADWRAGFTPMGRNLTVRVGGENLSGIAESIDASGHLHLRLPNGEIRVLASGETNFPA